MNDALLTRKPYPRTKALISKKMTKHIMGQFIYQLTFLLVLVFKGDTIWASNLGVKRAVLVLIILSSSTRLCGFNCSTKLIAVEFMTRSIYLLVFSSTPFWSRDCLSNRGSSAYCSIWWPSFWHHIFGGVPMGHLYWPWCWFVAFGLVSSLHPFASSAQVIWNF